MLAMHNATIISISDLKRLVVGCRHCNTKVVIDLVNPPDLYHKHGVLITKTCPGCQSHYDIVLDASLDALQKALAGLRPLAEYINFPIDDAIPSKQ